MRRRDILWTVAGATLAGGAEGADTKPGVLELKRYQMRNTTDNQSKRTTDFLQHGWLPAVQKAGAGTVGVFGSVVAAEGPFVLTVTYFPSLAALESADAKLADDGDYQKQVGAWASAGLPYSRMENSVLRCFATMPAIEVPPQEGRTGSRLFEMRTYESNSPVSLAKKVKMFNEGEIAIFRKSEMLPVFFGETIIGPSQPNLVYMLGYDDMTMREKVWKTFVGSPEWKKLSSQPGLSDADIVSNISNAFLRPLPFSGVK